MIANANRVEFQNGFVTTPCMVEHNQDVLDGYEYNLDDLKFSSNVLNVLDIGANHGAFLWYIFASGCFKLSGDSHINYTAYEPQPENFELLKYNVRQLAGSVEANLIKRAVVSSHGLSTDSVDLYDGFNNAGEATLEPPKSWPSATKKHKVDATWAGELGNTHILKVDCEGNELKIVKAYLEGHGRKKDLRAKKPLVICLEYQLPEKLLGVLKYMEGMGYKTVCVKQECHQRGSVVMVNL